MDQDWILQKKEIRRLFSRSTWVSLRTDLYDQQNNGEDIIGYTNEFFGCGSVAFPLENRDKTEKLSWGNTGLATTIMFGLI